MSTESKRRTSKTIIIFVFVDCHRGTLFRLQRKCVDILCKFCVTNILLHPKNHAEQTISFSTFGWWRHTPKKACVFIIRAVFIRDTLTFCRCRQFKMKKYLIVCCVRMLHVPYSCPWGRVFFWISFTLWHFREDARVCVSVSVVRRIFTTGLFDYVENVNNSSFS